MEIRSGDDVAFRQVYNELFPVLMKVAYHVTFNADVAEDICQDAFIRFYDKDMVFPSLEEAKYWLLRVVKNLSINQVKKMMRETASLEKIKKAPQVNYYRTGEQELLMKESRLAVRRAIYQLPETYRTVLVLKEYGGLDYENIAKVLDISESNVKVRVHRAKKELEVLLNWEGETYVPR